MSSTLSFTPGRRVWISAAVSDRKGATRSAGMTADASASAPSTAGRGAAKGMIFTVATICPASTGAKAGRVATVTLSSIRFSASMRSTSGTNRPCVSANRFTRPVKAAPTVMFCPFSAAAIRAAAASSPTSSGPSLAAVTVVKLASRSAAMSSALRIRPFLKLTEPRRTECARMAPSASRSGSGPKNMTSLPYAAPFRRRTAVTCAMMDTAISDGVTAPMSSPTGAWMRANSASVTPCSFRRSNRLAWVRRLPSEPT